MRKGGNLEVVLVGAQGIKHVNLVGTPVYQAILECGNKVYHSKCSSGKYGEVLWNQKFNFEFGAADWSNVIHLKIRIMNSRILRASKFVGQTVVHIGGIVHEARARGGVLEVKPTLYNVVLEDDTYRGEIRVGVKFMANTEGDEMTTKTASPAYSMNENRRLWLTIRKQVFRFLADRTAKQNEATKKLFAG